MSRNATRTYVRFQGPMSAEPVKALITTLNAIPETDEIHLDFRTNGGTVQEALRLYGALAKVSDRLTIYNTSRVASSGIVPFLAAGSRIASEDAEFFYHPIAIRLEFETPKPEAQIWFDRGQLIRWNEHIANDEGLYIRLHRKHTAITKAAILKLLSGNNPRRGHWAWEKKVVHRLGDFSPPPGVSVQELRFSPSMMSRTVSPKPPVTTGPSNN